MLAIFRPVHNGFGFEVRTFKFRNGRVEGVQALSIEEHRDILHTLPVLRCLKDCKNRTEYNQQFKDAFPMEYELSKADIEEVSEEGETYGRFIGKRFILFDSQTHKPVT